MAEDLDDHIDINERVRKKPDGEFKNEAAARQTPINNNRLGFNKRINDTLETPDQEAAINKISELTKRENKMTVEEILEEIEKFNESIGFEEDTNQNIGISTTFIHCTDGLIRVHYKKNGILAIPKYS